MKKLMMFFFAASIAVDLGAPPPPYQRTVYTTGTLAQADAQARAAVPTNTPIFAGVATFKGGIVGQAALDITGAATFNNTVAISDTLFLLGVTPLQMNAGAGVGKVMQSDVNGIASWATLTSSIPTNQGFAFALTYPQGAGPGKILTSDSTGLVAWASPPAPVPDFIDSGLVVDAFDNYTNGLAPSISGGSGWLANGICTGSNQIVARVNLDGVTRKALQIYSKGDYVRPFPWGTNWVKMRFGILWGVTNVGSTITNTFMIGICKGTNGGFHNSAVQWLGAGTEITGAVTTEYNLIFSNATGFAYYDSPFWASQLKQKTGGVFTASGSLSGSTGRGVAALPDYHVMILEITRTLTTDYPRTNDTITTTVYAPSSFLPTASSSVPSIVLRRPTIAMLINEVKLAAMGAIVNSTGSSLAIATKTGAFGQFDSFDFSWSGATNLCEIQAVVGYKVF